MLTRRRMGALLAAGAALAIGRAPARAQGKLVVYSANDANLNRFVFEAFARETGVEVEPVEGGSGVVFRRIASERERPLGDIVWGVSRALLNGNVSHCYAGVGIVADSDPEDELAETEVKLQAVLPALTGM